MKTLVTSDWHLSSNPRDVYRHKILRRLRKLAAELKISQTFILGDLTESKDQHNDWLTNAVVEHITRFAELGPVTILQGNHDYLNDPDMPFFRFLRLMPNVRWIGLPTSFFHIGLGRVLFLPHTRNYKKDWGTEQFDAKFIFAHNTFEGAHLGRGRIADDGIPTKLFPKTATVISGDVHSAQSGKVTYVGAPYRIDFGDDYEPRVLIIDDNFETPKIASVPVTGPQKRLFEWGYDNIGDLNPGDILKIRIKVLRSQAAEYIAQRDEARAWAAKHGFKVHIVQPEIVEDAAPGKKSIRRAEIKSDQQVIKEFAAHRGIDERMLKYGKRFL